MIDQFLIGNHRNFVYLITGEKESFVVDPQKDFTPWESKMKELGSKLTGILLTHTHWDHIDGVENVIEKYGQFPIYMHEKDAHRMQKYPQKIKDCFHFIQELGSLKVGDLNLEILHTPGHSAGACSYFIKEKKFPALLTGDTVFVGEVGRTDLETGSTQELFTTLQRLKSLPPETIIYPGHDYGKTPTSTIARETLESAAFCCKTVEELDDLP